MAGVYYHDYLDLDRILAAQRPVSGEGGPPAHDEMLFIVVHQAYELWFRQIRWELDDVTRALGGERFDEHDLGRVVARLRRITTIQQLLVSQIDVLETMTPMDFLDFRDHLVPASGFQSWQFRLIENRLGVRRQDRLLFEGAPYTHRLSAQHRRTVEEAEREPSLHDLVEAWLARTPFLETYPFWEAYREAVRAMLDADARIVAGNPTLTDEERDQQLASFERTMDEFEAAFDEGRHRQLVESGGRRFSYRAFQAALFISLYRDQPALHLPHQLLQLLVDIDEGFTTWRYRHALMTQRMIGAKVGTGGSAGAKYLLRLAERARAFPDLLLLPTFIVPSSARPELPAEVVDAMRFRYQA